MSYNGSGTFNINTTGQPVVAGTVITASAFNALTADLATGLTTAITKDGQTTTTAQIPFAQGLRSTLVTDSSSVSTGSIITDGGMGVAKNLYVGGTLNVTGGTSFTNPTINNIKMGYTTTATAGGSTSLTVSSNYRQFFTGTSTQTIVLPVTSTLVTGMAYEIENNSTGLLTVNSSGGNLVGTIPAGVCAHAVCIGTTLTTAADWDWDYISTTTITGTGANVLSTSPTITTATLASPNITTALTLTGSAGTAGQALVSGGSGNAPTWTTISSSPTAITNGTSNVTVNSSGGTITAATAGTTAITIDTSQNVGIGTTSPISRLHVSATSADVETRCASTGANYVTYRLKNSSQDYSMQIRTDVSNAWVIRDETSSANRFWIRASDGLPFSPPMYANTSGNSANVVVNADGGVLRSTSALKYKKDIRDLPSIDINKFRPVVYKSKCEGDDQTKDHFGFIADEVDAAGIKELVQYGAKGEIEGFSYDRLTAVLVKSVQELKAINDTQAETITALTARITALENA